jgi:hypothetical protein
MCPSAAVVSETFIVVRQPCLSLRVVLSSTPSACEGSGKIPLMSILSSRWRKAPQPCARRSSCATSFRLVSKSIYSPSGAKGWAKVASAERSGADLLCKRDGIRLPLRGEDCHRLERGGAAPTWSGSGSAVSTRGWLRCHCRAGGRVGTGRVVAVSLRRAGRRSDVARCLLPGRRVRRGGLSSGVN